MYSLRVALHVTTIRVYMPSLLPSSLKQGSRTHPGTRIVLVFTPLFYCVVFVSLFSIKIAFILNGQYY